MKNKSKPPWVPGSQSLVKVGDRRRNVALPIVLDEYKRAIAEHFDARTDYSRSKTHVRLAERLVRLAAPQPDERVLDIATGTGFVAILAAQLVGVR
jgi:cyclopropane fatty-acyl-phospholipid synthase-like methyltransferase